MSFNVSVSTVTYACAPVSLIMLSLTAVSVTTFNLVYRALYMRVSLTELSLCHLLSLCMRVSLTELSFTVSFTVPVHAGFTDEVVTLSLCHFLSLCMRVSLM